MSSGFAEVGENALQDKVKKAGRDIGAKNVGPELHGIIQSSSEA